MAGHPTRREFIQQLAAGGAASSGILSAGQTRGGQAPSASPGPHDRSSFRNEVRRRTARELSQRRLVVDYYRIRQKLAYPLPVPQLSVPEIVVPGIKAYPWATWMTWALEERIAALGWAAEWLGDKTAQTAAAADLAALAAWPEYRQFDQPDLSSAHAGRILWAATRWTWLDDSLRAKILAACRRHVDSVGPKSEHMFGSIHGKNDVLRRKDPHLLLHNIPFIGTVGAALTASACGHAAADALHSRIEVLFGAILDLRSSGYTEGVGYDGYVLDFVADWLGTLPEPRRSAILAHPRLADYLDESYMLGVPGSAVDLAELSDVEPRQMPFHLSAHAKLLRFHPAGVAAWLLNRVPLDCLRVDALAALDALPPPPPMEPPPAGALDAHYALVLRSGWEAEDAAVALSCTNSPMGHLQADGGTLLIGTRGHWLISDPGYQQYMSGDEREFTIGPTAHNAPLINGTPLNQKRPRRLALEGLGSGVFHAAVDLTACYPRELGLKSLMRHVWLSGNDLVVVADQIIAPAPTQATYHWHGDPACAWWVDGNWALLSLDQTRLWFTAGRAQFSGANLHRLPGSRGQLTLVTAIPSAGPIVWWAFALGCEPPELHCEADGRQLQVGGRTFRV